MNRVLPQFKSGLCALTALVLCGVSSNAHADERFVLQAESTILLSEVLGDCSDVHQTVTLPGMSVDFGLLGCLLTPSWQQAVTPEPEQGFCACPPSLNLPAGNAFSPGEALCDSGHYARLESHSGQGDSEMSVPPQWPRVDLLLCGSHDAQCESLPPIPTSQVPLIGSSASAAAAAATSLSAAQMTAPRPEFLFLDGLRPGYGRRVDRPPTA